MNKNHPTGTVLENQSQSTTSPIKPHENPTEMINLGRHLLAEFYECNSNILNNVDYIEQVMTEAAVECGATVVQKNFHMFNPFGVSGVVIIAESHLAIHTWPELGYAAVDLFTCGESCDPKVAYAYLQEKFMAKSAFYSELKRGMMAKDTSEVVKTPFIVSHEENTGDGVTLTPELRFCEQSHEVISQYVGGVQK